MYVQLIDVFNISSALNHYSLSNVHMQECSVLSRKQISTKVRLKIWNLTLSKINKGNFSKFSKNSVLCAQHSETKKVRKNEINKKIFRF